MQLFSQRDPRWASRRLGKNGQPMAKIGCTVTCLAMLSTFFKPDRTPGQIADLLRFTDDGRIIWESVNFENWKFWKRSYICNFALIDAALADPNNAVILEVNGGTHWVVVVGKTFFLDRYKIADPINGDYATMERYKNNITGAAYFIRK